MKKNGLGLAAFLCVAGMLVFTAFGSVEHAEAADKPYEGTELYILAAEHFWFGSIEVLFDDFEAETGCKIVVDKIAERNLYDQIKTRITPATSDYDIIVVDVVWLSEFVRNGILEQLDPYLSREDLKDPNWELDNIITSYVQGLSTYNEKLWTIPLGGHSNFLAYNTEMFAEAGIEKAPETMEELLETAKKLTTADHSGIVFRGRKGHPIDYTWLQYFYPFGGEFFDEQWRPQLSSENGIKSLEFLLELAQYAPPDVGSYTFGEMLTSFQQEKAAIYQDANVPGIIENPTAGEKIVGKVAYASFPHEQKDMTVLAGWSLGIAKASENKELAWKLLQYQSNKVNAIEAFKAGRDPILKSTFASEEAKAAMPDYPFDVVLDNLEKANPDFRPRIPEISKIQDVLGLYLSEALSGVKTPEEALQKADEEITKIMDAAGYY